MAERIRPIVHLLFACDDAVYDTGIDQWVLTHPWFAVALPSGATFPFRAEMFWVYAQLTDGLGEFEIGVEIRHLVDDQPARVVGWSSVTSVEFPDGGRLLAIDTAFALRGVPFREPGLYEIRILANGDMPGSWVLLSGASFEFSTGDGWYERETS